MKKWLRRIALSVAFLLLAIVAVGAGYEWLGRRGAQRDFPPTGKLVDIGGRRIQVDCRGTGAPTVVLVSGLDINGALAWSAVHDSIAATSRTCAYSRAGIMWSDPSPDAVTAKGVADDLHAALSQADEHPPFVMVGHSLGGPYIMTYTKYYGEDVAGLVMVDASHPEQLQRMAALAPAAGNPESVLGPIRIAAALSWAGVARFATSRTPPMPHQSEAAARAVSAYATHSLPAALKEMIALDTVFKEAGTFRQLGDRPLFVLSAMKPMTDAERATLKLTPEKGREFKALWKSMHDEEASWSTRSQHRLLGDATHYIQFDRPDVVIDAVRSVVDSVRATPAGGINGFSSELHHYLDDSVITVVLTNVGGPVGPQLQRLIARRAPGIKDLPTVPIDAAGLARVAGEYAIGNVRRRVFVENGGLRMQSGAAPAFGLKQVGNGRFVRDDNDDLQFDFAAGTPAPSLVRRQGANTTTATRI